jgi:D-lactate dehydrogenase
MKICFFDTHKFERKVFEHENVKLQQPHEISFIEARLTPKTAPLGRGYPAICAFVNDVVSQEVIQTLADGGLKLIALRSAGFNHVDLVACKEFEVRVVRVPAYSPHAVAEHALCLILALNRKIHRAYQRVRELNFSLEGLVGFDLYGKTVGVVGTGKIGAVFAAVMRGLGCRVLAYDVVRDEGLVKEHGVEYVSLDELYRSSDVISLHVPLRPETQHIIDGRAIEQMKSGVMLINTGRGGLIDTKALIDGLKTGKVGAAGLDVYEEEEGVFFLDLSDRVLLDDTLARLLTFPNVLVTAHQAFLTTEALTQIAATTLESVSDFEAGRPLVHEIRS